MACTDPIHSDPIDIVAGSTFVDIERPVPGSKLLSYWLEKGVSTTFWDTTVEILPGGIYRFRFNVPAPAGHRLWVIWEDPGTAESFAAQKSFTVITKGFIPSCECGCGALAPIKKGEFISIIVGFSVDPTGLVQALVESANRAHDDPSRWVYQLGVQDPSLDLTKADIRGFSCC